MSTNQPHRAWVEVNIARLRTNFELIFQDKPPSLKMGVVVKDDAYGHGAHDVAREALRRGAALILVSNVEEGLDLREQGIDAPILVFGERAPDEYAVCLEKNLMPTIGSYLGAQSLTRLAERRGSPATCHLEIDTGMGRWGFQPETEFDPLLEVARDARLNIAGVYTHFPKSDELDKSFAQQQIHEFHRVVDLLESSSRPMGMRHLCNTGGFLDLPDAHADMVRIGILPLGVYPSKVCRRIPGIRPTQSVKTYLARVKRIPKGANVGYGLRYQAPEPRVIGVLPIGYGDGMPRLRNQGGVLIRGAFAPVIGGNAMDATMVDLTAIREASPFDEAVIVGHQGDEEISIHQIAEWKRTVSYEAMTAWRHRLPRIVIAEEPTP